MPDPAPAAPALPPIALPPITREQLVRYAGASGDFNPIHWDADFARAAGYPGPIAHGMLGMALMARACIEWAALLGASPPEAAVARLSARFRSVTFPGDTLTITAAVTARRSDPPEIDLSVQAARQDGTVTTTAEATLRLGPATPPAAPPR